MRGLMPTCDVKTLTVEDGLDPDEIRSDRFNVFKWFITANIVLLIIFCGYALWSLYQLNNVMRPTEDRMSLQKYYANRKVDDQEKGVPDFQDLNRTIMEVIPSEGESNDAYENLKLLLHKIGNIVERKKTNETMSPKMSFKEAEVLKQFVHLRYPRTIRGGEDESQCNMQFTVRVTNNNEPVDLYVKPAKQGAGMVNIKSTTNYMKKDKVESDTRECSFNIIYQPTNKDANAI